MPDNAVSGPSSGLPFLPREAIDGLLRDVLPGLPIVERGTVLTEQILRQIGDLVKNNIAALPVVGGILGGAGIAALVPSLCVVIVHAIGFTSGGVAAGSLAALIQSVFYGANAGGLFSVLQAFGAAAAVASPALLIMGGTATAAGAVALGDWLWEMYHGQDRDD